LTLAHRAAPPCAWQVAAVAVVKSQVLETDVLGLR